MEEEEQRAEEEQLRQTRREFQELVKSPAWVRLVEYAQAQVMMRTEQVAIPADGFDSLVKGEFLKGEMGGINLFMNMPKLIIDDFGEQIQEFVDERKENEDGS